MRVVFMGSPEFAVPSLAALHAEHEVAGIVTQPDRPAGRGRKLVEPPVKSWATSHGLSVAQPESVNRPEATALISAWRPEVIVVAAFGQILRPALLAIPRLGCVNLHASLLPRWRGASPIQTSILEGDAQTGVSLMLMDEGMDTGPLLTQVATEIAEDDTGGSLSARLAGIAAQVLVDHLPEYAAGRLRPTGQDSSLATHARLLKKADGRLNPQFSAERLGRQVRAFNPWPGTFFEWRQRRINVLEANPAPNGAASKPGQVVLSHDRFPAIQTTSGILILRMIQPAGRARMSAIDFINGAPDLIGESIRPQPA